MLGRLGSKAQIPALVRKFERLRRERIARVRNETFRQQEQFHLPDGERQEARDVLLGKSFGDPDERMSW